MTVRHVVLFIFHPGVVRDDPRVTAAAAITRDHVHHIDEIEAWWSGFDESDRAIAADFMAMGLFENPEAVVRYIEHPHHRLGLEAWRKIADWIVLDITEAIAQH